MYLCLHLEALNATDWGNLIDVQLRRTPRYDCESKARSSSDHLWLELIESCTRQSSTAHGQNAPDRPGALTQ